MKSALRDEAEGPSVPQRFLDEPLFPRLKPGPGRPASEVAANQRARLCGAMVELVGLRGYGGVTVRELSRLAGVSTKTFYDCFANVGECFAVTHARIARGVLGRTAIANEDDAVRLRARLRALFVGLAADPKAAQFVLVESLVAGPSVPETGREINRAFEQLIVEEFATASPPVTLRPALAHGIAFAVLQVVRSHLPDRRSQLPVAADRIADWLLALRDERLVQMNRRSDAELGIAAKSRHQHAKGDERRLLLAAAERLAVREGYGSLTAPAIRREAGVSRRRFDEHFEGIEDCFLAAVEARLVAAADRAKLAAARAGCWERGLVRAVADFAAGVARNPSLAHLALIDILAPGRPGLELRERVITNSAKLLRATAPVPLRSDDLIAEASVAAAWGIAEAHVAAGRSDWVQAEIPCIAFVALAPLMGPEAAEHAISTEYGSVGRRRVIKHSAQVS